MLRTQVIGGRSASHISDSPNFITKRISGLVYTFRLRSKNSQVTSSWAYSTSTGFTTLRRLAEFSPSSHRSDKHWSTCDFGHGTFRNINLQIPTAKMTPNLFLATQKMFSPHKWFQRTKTERSTRVTEYWTTPQPGQYEYVPGRGWFLIATLVSDLPDVTVFKTPDVDAITTTTVSPQREFTMLPRPIPIHRSRVLGRYLLEADYKDRKKTSEIKNERGKRIQAGFFRLDNGVAWVHCWDENGVFIPGGETGYKLWCIDAATQQFRHMKKGDDPNFVRSRPNSPSRDSTSQQSVSTAFPSAPGSTKDAPSLPGTRPGSTKDGPSGPSTRASSIRTPFSPTSTPSSRTHSRRGSPKRNNSIPLEEAKAALRRMAKEQQEAVAAAAVARTRTKSSETVQQLERGRSTARVAS